MEITKKPWRTCSKYGDYFYEQDYNVDDKLDRLREAVLAVDEKLAGMLRCLSPNCQERSRLAMLNLLTAEEREDD